MEGQQGSRFGSQFAVTLRKCAARDGHALAFGRLLRGFGALRQIEKVDLGSRRQPLQPVVITACGELEPGDDGVVVGEDGDPFTPWPQVRTPARAKRHALALYFPCGERTTLRGGRAHQRRHHEDSSLLRVPSLGPTT